MVGRRVVVWVVAAACAMTLPVDRPPGGGAPGGAAQAQERLAGAPVVRGVVRARSGRPLADATVEFRGAGDAVAATATTDAAGAFALAVPASTAGTIVVRRVGFRPASLSVPALAEGRQRDMAVALEPRADLSVVNVIAERDRPLLDTEDAAVGGTVERRELERLPTDARDPITLAFTIPGVAPGTGFFGDAPKLTINAQNSLYTQYSLDGLENNEGFLGGPRVEVPLSALARFGVLANTYSAAFGRSSNGVVNAETRAGGERWSGEAFLYSRPGLPVDARAKVIPSGQDPDDFRRAQEGFRRTQVGGAGGGPLVRGRTYAFGAVEYTTENEDRIASTASATFLGREARGTLKLFGRLDHGWSANQTTTLRVAASDVERAGEGSGIVAPEADITVRRRGTASALIHRSAMRGGRASNELAVQMGTYLWSYPPTRSSFAIPQVTIRQVQGSDTVAVGVVGSSNFVFDESELQFQLRNVFETAIGTRHTFRTGFDAWRSDFRLAGSFTNPSGSYEVLNEGNIPRRGTRYAYADIPANVRVLSYTIDAAQKQVDLSQMLVGLFVEDRWQVTPSLALNLGVRWDYDDLTSRGNSEPDLDNVQPRASVTWLATPTSVVRAGAGSYVGKFPYAVYSDAIQFGPDGNQTVTFRGTQAPAFGQGPRSAALDRSTLPPGEVRELFALGLEQPLSNQYTLGWQTQLGARWAVGLDGIWTETYNLPRSWDLNASTRVIGPNDTTSLAPTAGDPFRPVAPVAGGYRRRTTTESGGRADYRALVSTLRYQATNTLILDGNWTFSRARTNTEDINFNATQGNRFDLEWADAVNDRRHKVTGRATWTAVRNLAVAAIADFQTGQPVNRVAFFRDLDGSGGTFGNGFLGNDDRFFGVPRNGERLPSEFLAHLSVGYLLPLRTIVRASTLELRADVFNVFNTTTASGFANGIPGGGARTQVGRPGDPIVISSAGPPRQLQFSLRYAF